MPRASKSITDVVLPMQDPYMSQIISGTKNYEFRKYRLKPGVKRIWFYRTAPHSALSHICGILPARTRNPGDNPLDENGLGNAEFNNRHRDWIGYDFAYKIISVYELPKVIPLAEMRATYGFKAAPRGLVYLPQPMGERIVWYKQKPILKHKNARVEEESTIRTNERKNGDKGNVTGLILIS
ncbi:MAG: hypothetical protein Q9170_007410 [Blastenia crenularia]